MLSRALGMTPTTSPPIRSLTCFIILRSGDWDGHWMVDISVTRFVLNVIKKDFWQCFDIIVRIHVFIENDQIANTVVANNPPPPHPPPHPAPHPPPPPTHPHPTPTQPHHHPTQPHHHPTHPPTPPPPPPPPPPLQKRFDFYLPCVDIRVYIYRRLFSIPSPSRHNMQGGTLIYREKSKQDQGGGGGLTQRLRQLLLEDGNSIHLDTGVRQGVPLRYGLWEKGFLNCSVHTRKCLYLWWPCIFL